MALDSPSERCRPLLAVPEQHRRCAPALPADRIVRQLEGIDAWNAGRRVREQLLSDEVASRQDRLEVSRQMDVLRRTQAVIQERAARELADERGPMAARADRTAVVAHRQAWFTEKVCQALRDRGVVVVACTDNAADALGAVVAEQPDIVLAGHRLAMMTGADLLLQTRLFAAAALCAAQLADESLPFPWHGSADAVFLPRHQPTDIADALVRLL